MAKKSPELQLPASETASVSDPFPTRPVKPPPGESAAQKKKLARQLAAPPSTLTKLLVRPVPPRRPWPYYNPLKRDPELQRRALSEPLPETGAHLPEPLQAVTSLSAPSGEVMEVVTEAHSWRAVTVAVQEFKRRVEAERRSRG